VGGADRRFHSTGQLLENKNTIPPLFSEADDTQFGSFHYALGLLEFSLSPEARKGFERIRKGQKFTSDDGEEKSLTRLAYEMLSLFHEMRHFVDMFGTITGCALFWGHIERLKEFLTIGEILGTVGANWKFLLVKWSGEQDCPPEIRKFIREARAFSVGADLFIAPFKLIELDGHRDDLILEVDYVRGGKADAFPMRVGVVKNGVEQLRTILFPIGLEALTEATAHAISRDLVSNCFPEAISQRLKQHSFAVPASSSTHYNTHSISFTFAKSQLENEQALGQMATPYMAVDLMITRVLERRGITKFPRSLIFEVVDHVLSTTEIKLIEVSPTTSGLYFGRLGDGLLDLLNSEDKETLELGHLANKTYINSAYKGLATKLERLGDWRTVKDDRSPLSSLRIWEAYVAKSFILPLLRERISTAGRAFTSTNDFLILINKLGASCKTIDEFSLVRR